MLRWYGAMLCKYRRWMLPFGYNMLSQRLHSSITPIYYQCVGNTFFDSSRFYRPWVIFDNPKSSGRLHDIASHQNDYRGTCCNGYQFQRGRGGYTQCCKAAFCFLYTLSPIHNCLDISLCCCDHGYALRLKGAVY